MYIDVLYLIILIILSLISLILGILLTIKGKPYNNTLSIFHKLCSFMSGFLFCVIFIINLIKYDINFKTAILGIITSFFFILSIITGSLLLTKKYDYTFVKYIHRIISFVTYIFGIITILL